MPVLLRGTEATRSNESIFNALDILELAVYKEFQTNEKVNVDYLRLMMD